MIYVDPIQTHPIVGGRVRRFGTQWCHMATDGDPEELHLMARRLGLSRSYFQEHDSVSHYDLTPSKRRQAVQFGAREVSSVELFRVCRNEE